MVEELGYIVDYFDNLVDVFEDVGISNSLRYEDVYRVQHSILKRLKWLQKETGSDSLKEEIDQLKTANPYDKKYLRIDDGWVTVEIKYPPSEINIPYLNSIVWRDKSCYYNPEHDVWINRRDFVNYGDLVKSQLGKKFRFTSFKSFYRKIRKVWKIPNGYTIYLVFRQQTDSGGSKSLILQV